MLAMGLALKTEGWAYHAPKLIRVGKNRIIILHIFYVKGF
jgi:hypothetical protein